MSYQHIAKTMML